MKQSSHTCVLFLILFLVLLSSSSARLLTNKQGKEMLKLSEISHEENFEKLMGAEVCETVDAECLKRRIISEAHLDYIYTQHHKP